MGNIRTTEADIREEVRKKADRIRARNYSDGYIAEKRDHYYALYRYSVLEAAATSEYYIIYKAYDVVAKERGL